MTEFHYLACRCDDSGSCGDDLRAGSLDVIADFDRGASHIDSERVAGRLLPVRS